MAVVEQHRDGRLPAPGQSARKVIYDLGANNGDDIPYYLMKSDLVVAVEANPVLCAKMLRRFSAEIEAGRLVVENCVLTADGHAGEVHFHVHLTNDQISQFPAPENPEEFERILLPSKSLQQLLDQHGQPHYVKVDIEHYDQVILRELFGRGVRPPFISAESHSVEVFALMVVLGGYNAFKLVDGRSVPQKYRDHRIAVSGGEQVYSFPLHSAGPFGEDIDGDWLGADDFFRMLAVEGLGWKDIHATRCFPPVRPRSAKLASFIKAKLKRKSVAALSKLFGARSS